MASKALKKCPKHQHYRSDVTPTTKEPLTEGLMQKKPAGLGVTYTSLTKRTVKELKY